MRRNFVFLLWASVLLSCGKGGEQSASEIARAKFEADSAALKVAVTPTLDCLPLFIAADNGLFQREGLDVQLWPYQAQMDQDTALVAGRVEGMTTDLVRVARLRSQGTPMRCVAATALNWQLVTNPTARIRLLSQMDDKMMAMTRYSATALLSDLAVDSARLKPERVYRIQVNDVAVRLSMMETGVMDAMLLPEPQATQARNGGSPVLMDTREKDLRLGVIAFSEAALADTARQHQVDRFLRVYNMACDSISRNGVRHYADLIMRRCGVAPATVDSLPDSLAFAHAAPPRQADVDHADAWLRR